MFILFIFFLHMLHDQLVCSFYSAGKLTIGMMHTVAWENFTVKKFNFMVEANHEN